MHHGIHGRIIKIPPPPGPPLPLTPIPHLLRPPRHLRARQLPKLPAHTNLCPAPVCNLLALGTEHIGVALIALAAALVELVYGAVDVANEGGGERSFAHCLKAGVREWERGGYGGVTKPRRTRVLFEGGAAGAGKVGWATVKAAKRKMRRSIADGVVDVTDAEAVTG